MSCPAMRTARHSRRRQPQSKGKFTRYSVDFVIAANGLQLDADLSDSAFVSRELNAGLRRLGQSVARRLGVASALD